jgi:hypothetical protein
MPTAECLSKVSEVILRGVGNSNNPYERLVVDVEMCLPDAVKNADAEIKTEMIGKLIKELASHLGPLEEGRKVEDLLGKAEVFLKECEGKEWGRYHPKNLVAGSFSTDCK